MRWHWASLIIGLLLTVNVNAETTTFSAMPEVAKVCAACHGPDGNSLSPIWPKLAAQHAKYFIKQMQDFKQGPEGPRYNVTMHGMAAGLSDDDIALLANYYAQQPISPGKANPELIKLGETIYRAGDRTKGISACTACHGPRGLGNGQAGFPRLSGQFAQYTELQMNAYKDGSRSNDANGIMRDIAQRMTEQQIKAVASYLEGLH
ncbi:MAG: c-type cytochrome [Gammaproteobacteria bacterium]